MFLHVIMVIGGLFIIGWGFWAAHNAKKPLDLIGSFSILIGLAAAVIGTLLLCVPGFFSS